MKKSTKSKLNPMKKSTKSKYIESPKPIEMHVVKTRQEARRLTRYLKHTSIIYVSENKFIVEIYER